MFSTKMQVSGYDEYLAKLPVVSISVTEDQPTRVKLAYTVLKSTICSDSSYVLQQSGVGHATFFSPKYIEEFTDSSTNKPEMFRFAVTAVVNHDDAVVDYGGRVVLTMPSVMDVEAAIANALTPFSHPVTEHVTVNYLIMMTESQTPLRGQVSESCGFDFCLSVAHRAEQVNQPEWANLSECCQEWKLAEEYRQLLYDNIDTIDPDNDQWNPDWEDYIEEMLNHHTENLNLLY